MYLTLVNEGLTLNYVSESRENLLLGFTALIFGGQAPITQCHVLFYISHKNTTAIMTEIYLVESGNGRNNQKLLGFII